MSRMKWDCQAILNHPNLSLGYSQGSKAPKPRKLWRLTIINVGSHTVPLHAPRSLRANTSREERPSALMMLNTIGNKVQPLMGNHNQAQLPRKKQKRVAKRCGLFSSLKPLKERRLETCLEHHNHQEHPNDKHSWTTKRAIACDVGSPKIGSNANPSRLVTGRGTE